LRLFLRFSGQWHLAALFNLDEGNDVVIAPVFGEHEGGGGVTVGIDARPRVGALLHLKVHHFRRAIHDGKVNRASLIAVGHGHVGQFRASVEHAASLGEVVGADSIRKAPNGDTVDVGFELGPAFEAVGAGKNQLGIVQGEVGTISAAVVGLDRHCSFGFVIEEGAQQFLRLAFKLIELWMFVDSPGG
jgi:hypothetical protein